MKRHCLGVFQRYEVRRLVSSDGDVARIEEICQHGGKDHFLRILNVLCIAQDNWHVGEAIRLMRQHFLDRCPEGDYTTQAGLHAAFLDQLAHDISRRAA